MSHRVADLCGFLSGQWRIARRIDDRRLGIVGRLTGRVTFTPSPGGLIQDEDGDLAFGAYRGPARRRYQLVMDHSSAGEIRHADGSLFHALDLTSGRAEILHRCGDDMYRGRYRVLRDDRFAVTWHVTGPRKNYRLSTIHARLGEAEKSVASTARYSDE
ncbi:MAG: DUF6314 family protein [Rhizomicrobium sp.]